MAVDIGMDYVSSELSLPQKRLPSPQQLWRMRQIPQGKGRIAILRKVSNPKFGFERTQLKMIDISHALQMQWTIAILVKKFWLRIGRFWVFSQETLTKMPLSQKQSMNMGI